MLRKQPRLSTGLRGNGHREEQVTLEGRLRELAIEELLQLLSAGRKTGTLRISAALEGSSSEIVFERGAIVGATLCAPTAVRTVARQFVASTPARERESIEECVLQLLTWKHGEFHFTASRLTGSASGLRLAVEPLLVEAANRAQVWAAVADRVADGTQIPVYVDARDKISALRLTPKEWEALSRVDGKLSIGEIAVSFDKPLLELVQIIHGLIGHGLISLSDVPARTSAHPTPPSSAFVPADDIFGHVASDEVETTRDGAETAETKCRADTSLISQPGDDAARTGDFIAAISHWNSALDEISRSFGMHRMVEEARIRESIALATRLNSILGNPSCGTSDNR